MRRISATTVIVLCVVTACDTYKHDFDLALTDVSAARDAGDVITVHGTVSCLPMKGVDCATLKPSIRPAIVIYWVPSSQVTSDEPPSSHFAIMDPAIGDCERVSDSTWTFELSSPQRVPTQPAFSIVVEAAPGRRGNGSDRLVISSP